MSIIGLNAPETGSFLVNIILWLVMGTGSVALGVVLFTVILKVITLPFDFISRSSMRKNSIKMEEMRPELEKLQKQYADNKDLYNQKMMALYKKNGYSLFGSCLPTIITLVIFIVAINAFNDYASYQNQKYFYDMSIAYDSVLYEGLETDDVYIVKGEDGKLVIDADKIKTEAEKNGGFISVGEGENAHEIFVKEKTFYTTNSYVYYDSENKNYSAREEGLDSKKLASDKNNDLTILRDGKNLSFAEVKSGDNAMTAEEFIKDLCEQRSADTFDNNGSSFLWVKNIWAPDVTFRTPVEKKLYSQDNEQTFSSLYGKSEGGGCSCNGSNKMTIMGTRNDVYNDLTAKLEDKKTAPNGYYIFVILTAGISLLTQLVLSKGQKAQMELQTVDGQGAQTQKMMMWMMPVMMAFFAFMYTAAFSIYIVCSSLISMLSTIAINKIVDKKYKTKKNDSDVIRSKKIIREAEEERKAAEERKNKPKKKKDEPQTGDFLSGEADKKKHVRGRLK